MTTPTRRLLACALGVGLIAAASAASAHITLFPRQATLGESIKYQVRVPNERKVPTVKIEGTFPAEVKVVSIDDNPGWTAALKRNAAGAIVGVTWTGSLPAEGFTQFGVNAVNPAAGEGVTWQFLQYYEGGETVSWTGPKGSKTPAPVVALYAPGKMPPPAPPPVRLPRAPAD